MNRCVNCGIATGRYNLLRGRAIDNETTLSVIRQWLAPQPVISSDHICQACWDLAQRSSVDEPRQLGHRTVCPRCGRSLASRVSHLLNTGSTRELRIYNVIQEWIMPRTVEKADRICHTCWVAADRAAIHMTGPSSSSQRSFDKADISGNTNQYLSVKTALPRIQIQPPLEEPQLAAPNTNLLVSDIEGDTISDTESIQELANVDVNSGDEDVPGTTSRNTSVVSSSGYEIKVFCPKCNTEVSHTAGGIQEDQTKILVAKVYHYFEQEYEELKKIYGDLDLTPLSKFHQRTALATGVSETTLLQILKEEEERNADKRRKPPRKRRAARKRHRQTDSSSEEDSSDGNVNGFEQPRHVEETLLVKIETPEYNNEEPENSEITLPTEVKSEPISDGEIDNEEPEIFIPPVKVEPSDVDTDKQQTDPISLEVKSEPGDDVMDTEHTDPISEDVKTEPRDDEVDSNTTNETLALNESADGKRKGRKTSRNSDDISIQSSLSEESLLRWKKQKHMKDLVNYKIDK